MHVLFWLFQSGVSRLRHMIGCVSTATRRVFQHHNNLNLSFTSLKTTLLTMSASDAKNPVWPTYSWKDRSPSTQLVYITDNYQADLEVVKLRGPLGFDLEWKPNFVKGRPENPVALVQLSDENTILLIQISAMAGMLLQIHPSFAFVAK